MYFKESKLIIPTILSTETLSLSCIRKVLSFVLLISGLFGFCSCLSTTRPYEFTVAFEFADISDESVIEARLKAFMFDINSKEIEGDKITYVLDHDKYVPNGLFELFCSRDVVSIEDKNGNVFLTREDVSTIKFDGSLIVARVSDDKYDKLIRVPIYFVLGDKRLWVNFGEKNASTKTVGGFPPDGVIGETIDENEEVYIKGALTLISELPKGKVTATIIEG